MRGAELLVVAAMASFLIHAILFAMLGGTCEWNAEQGRYILPSGDSTSDVSQWLGLLLFAFKRLVLLLVLGGAIALPAVLARHRREAPIQKRERFGAVSQAGKRSFEITFLFGVLFIWSVVLFGGATSWEAKDAPYVLQEKMSRFSVPAAIWWIVFGLQWGAIGMFLLTPIVACVTARNQRIPKPGASELCGWVGLLGGYLFFLLFLAMTLPLIGLIEREWVNGPMGLLHEWLGIERLR